MVPREPYHIECSFLFSALYRPCIRPRLIGPCQKPGRRCRPGWQRARRHGRRRRRDPCRPLLIVADWSCRCCRPLPSLGQAVRGRTLESADSKSPLITSSTERANEQERTFADYVARMHNQPVVNPMLITSRYRSQHIRDSNCAPPRRWVMHVTHSGVGGSIRTLPRSSTSWLCRARSRISPSASAVSRLATRLTRRLNIWLWSPAPITSWNASNSPASKYISAPHRHHSASTSAALGSELMIICSSVL